MPAEKDLACHLMPSGTPRVIHPWCSHFLGQLAQWDIFIIIYEWAHWLMVVCSLVLGRGGNSYWWVGFVSCRDKGIDHMDQSNLTNLFIGSKCVELLSPETCLQSTLTRLFCVGFADYVIIHVDGSDLCCLQLRVYRKWLYGPTLTPPIY